MLDVLRKQAGSWVVKVLLLLLVVSFAIWGIGDVFFGGAQDPAVAKVGETEITSSELATAFDRAVANLQRQFGPDFDRDRAIQMGLMQQTLQDLITRRLLDLKAQELGLTIDDETLRALVTTNPLFQSAGQFDRGRFVQLLQASGLSEDGYLGGLRQDVTRATLAGSLAGPVVAPKALVESIYRYQNEQRRGHYILVPESSITNLPEPSEDDLQTFHEEHQAEFTAPEYRVLNFITLEAADLTDEVEVSEDDITAAYQDRLDQYRTPEHRTVQQLLANDRAAIDKAAERLAEGASFADVATALAGEGVRTDDLGRVAKGELPDEFDQAIFGLVEGEVSTPVETPFGWHLFLVTAIEPEQVTPLAEVHDQLAEELALSEARDRLPTFAAQLDDELAAGASLAEAGATLGLEVTTTPALDVQGRDAEGKPIADLPPWPEFLTTAFVTPAGETSLLEETDAGAYFVVEVTAVTPPRVKPVEEVHDQLLAAWQAEQRRTLARARAEELLAEVRGGTATDDPIAAAGLATSPIAPLKRADAGTAQGINRAVVRALFATAPGEFADEVVELGAGFALVATDEVIDAEPSTDADGIAKLESELEADMRADLVAEFETALRQEYPVEIDGAVINRLFGTGGAA